MKISLSEELKWRGFVNQTTFGSPSQLDKKPLTFYFGVDPSADSMTIGNLAAAMMVRHFIEHGHKAILLVGGATGIIGDPDGKATEREVKTSQEIAKNKSAIVAQYKQIFAGEKFELVDNNDWFSDVGYVEFLRDIGKHMPMRQMLGREFVKARLREGGAGISYAEFSYALMQGYDFLHLYRTKAVTLQVCGSDQWGNSIAGVDLIRRIDGGEAHVWSAPLVVNKATMTKFGKSEAGAIWLESKKTSVYRFYQFWLNVHDEDAMDYLKIFTLLSRNEIEKVIKEFNADKSKRAAQKTLAYEATKIVHGQDAADGAKRATEALFGSSGYSALKDTDFELLKQELPLAQAAGKHQLLEVVIKTGLASSSSEARRFFEQGAIYLNGQPTKDPSKLVEPADLINGRYAIVRRGKNLNALIEQKD